MPKEKVTVEQMMFALLGSGMGTYSTLRPKHKEIQQVLEFADSKGWKFSGDSLGICINSKRGIRFMNIRGKYSNKDGARVLECKSWNQELSALCIILGLPVVDMVSKMQEKADA